MPSERELCGYCRTEYFDPEKYSCCYGCFLTEYRECIRCGRWHPRQYEVCYHCRWARYGLDATKELRAYILWRDGYRCRNCGGTLDLQVDHIRPCRDGGGAEPWNLQVLCGFCNQVKGASEPTEREEQYRDELVAYYFLAGRAWLTTKERGLIRREVRRATDNVKRPATGRRPLTASQEWLQPETY